MIGLLPVEVNGEYLQSGHWAVWGSWEEGETLSAGSFESGCLPGIGQACTARKSKRIRIPGGFF
ncbi:hypothetical protein LJK88_03455 [Paenibacillus sp. P26]|nr:hypothetical protein LJK88_03455 [Paenibacillus sp. P26]UUZ90836.1 hypothetical protein LJK87_34050 [Paenibacillus sp. P25]